MPSRPRSRSMIVLLLVALVAVIHLAAAAAATRIIAERIDEQNPPGGTFVPIPGGRLHLFDLPPKEAPAGPPVLLVHGATSNARDMLLALGDALSRRHRVIAVDRPGHGWSDRPDGAADASPARQATLIAEALKTLGVGKVVVVAHSLGGAVGTSFALDHPDQTAGLVLLAPVTHPWPGGITWYYRLAATPVLGDIFVNTLMTPVGAWGLDAAVDGAFAPMHAPADYARDSGAALVLRPWEFRWNGQDVAALLPFVERQQARYGAIRVPTAILASEEDTVVSTRIHARAIAAQIAGAKLTVLHGAGHQLQFNAREAVLAEIERVAGEAQATRL